MDEGEQLKRIVVQPMIDGIRQEMQPVIKLLNAHEARIAKVEAQQKRALVGYGALCLGGTAIWNWVQAKLRGSK